MDYNFNEIEPKWQNYWREHHTYRCGIEPDKPHFYVLDMFPYPSGAGLHVGHPLGYIASDIFARYKRLRGFNVLHPMGYDAYGLPAEQYAIQTGQHPAITTERNIARYREQLDKLGFSFDWEREVRTCDPKYYKWTQWTFIQLFNHYYDRELDKARPISELVKQLEEGTVATEGEKPWAAMSEDERQDYLMNFRLAYLADIPVNWCPELGTVLANDEVVNGLSVRGGYPVERKLMRQWSLRISAYAQRLVDGLEEVDWSESLKEIQRNWIGRSEGAAVWFPLDVKPNANVLPGAQAYISQCDPQPVLSFEIFTTRPDTIYGVTFMVLCPEHELIDSITTPAQRAEVEAYVAWAKNRSERERQAEVKKVSGVFTGSFAINPLTEERIPIWVSDYVLAGYGTGAIMAVPAHDSRDFAFARHFNLPIRQVVATDPDNLTDPDTWTESLDSKTGYSVNSGFVSGMKVKDAMAAVIDKIEEMGIGHRTVNYRLRDAIFSRQRYWGEPFPVYYKQGRPYTLPEECLPLLLPEVSDFKPTATGEPRHLLGLGRGQPPSGGEQQDRRQDCLPPRAEHHARLCRVERLLPPLYGPPQRPGLLQPRGRQLLAERRPLCGRRGTRHWPSDLRPFLEQVPLRYGSQREAGAFLQAGEPGHDSRPLQLCVSQQGGQQPLYLEEHPRTRGEDGPHPCGYQYRQ